VAGLAAFALIGAVLAAGTGSALASGSVWTRETSPNVTVPGGRIESISCSSATACTAVGTNVDTAGIKVTLAERWNGKIWRRQPTPNPPEDTAPGVAPDLLGVSCPALSFCAAVGAYSLGGAQVSIAEVWKGHVWAQEPVPFVVGSESAEMNQVSCTSARFCEAVGSYTPFGTPLALAATWNGTSWRLQYPPAPPGSIVNLDAVSCVSPTFCEAWGGGTPSSPGPSVAERWDGKSWHLQAVSANITVDSVSCVSARFCEAVGAAAGIPDADVWNGSSWRAQTMPGPGTMTGVSCTSSSFCEAVGGFFNTSTNEVQSDAALWNGKVWSAQLPPNPATAGVTHLNAVSCSAGVCEAGGNSAAAQGSPPRALAEGWNGDWRMQNAVAPAGATDNSLSAVSCVTATFCEAVGSHSDSAGNALNLAETWNGTAWKIQATPSPLSPSGLTFDGLDAVSCVSTDFCEAVGPGGAAVWNGTSWKVQATPPINVTPISVSCATVSFCMTTSGSGGVAIWNGASWSAGPGVSGFQQVASVSCVSASYCEAVGGGPQGENAAVWNGASWSPQPTAGPAGVVLDAISCLAVNSCEAVGATFGPITVTLAETWNGTSWAIAPTPNPPATQSSILNAVSCTSAASCTAVGQNQFTNLGLTRTLAEVWNGKTWSLRSTPSNVNAGENILDDVSCVTSAGCTAVGTTQDSGLFQTTLIEAGD